MPVRQFRRLEAPTASSLHARLSREALSYAWSAAEVDAIPPGLIIEREGNVLAAFGSAAQARLAYSFESDRDFIDAFPAMFEALLPKMRSLLGAETVRFRLALGSSRMAVEPVLKKLLFTPQRPWLAFSLDKKSARTSAAAPKGVTFREGDKRDIAEIVRIDREAFPDTPMPEAAYAHHLERGDRLLIAKAGGENAGFALYSYDGSAEGLPQLARGGGGVPRAGHRAVADAASGEVGVRTGRGPSRTENRRGQRHGHKGLPGAGVQAHRFRERLRPPDRPARDCGAEESKRGHAHPVRRLAITR